VYRWVSALAIVVSPSAFGWGAEGHALIARIAETQLTPKARQQVQAVLGPGTTLASIASWADEIRRSRPETAPWHYIDIPLSQTHVNLARDCPNAECVIAKIGTFEKALSIPLTPPRERSEALMFLVHLIGDMHQPLHAADNRDRGGNTVQVQLGGLKTNLHSLWDSALLARMGDAEQLASTWSLDSRKRARKWAKGTVERWAEESHAAARKVVYGKLGSGAPRIISAAYEKAADSLIREQIERAGARLAWVLNQTLQ
jgi:hypothetical protein